MRYIARQPIFDMAREVIGYELLFRRSRENVAEFEDPDVATKASIDAALLIGLDVFANGKKIFVNCTRESLLGGYATLFPAERTVVEVLESVEPDDEVIAACHKLREQGYDIALDDFVDHPRFAPFTKLANIIKVDFRATKPRYRSVICDRYLRKGLKLLAEKVETPEEYASAARLGFSLFQGYFFSRPVIMTAREVTGSRHIYLRLMQTIRSPETNLKVLEEIIKSEPALCYRLLRYLNSAAFAFRANVTSIFHAVTLLGENEMRKWLTVTCAVLATEGKPTELVKMALIRGRFCELMSENTSCASSDGFMVGLFSLMDAILDTPMRHILSQVALPPGVCGALRGEPGRLSELLELAMAYEGGEWSRVSITADRLCANEGELAACYVDAVSWVGAIGV